MNEYNKDFPHEVSEIKSWLKILQDLSQQTCECEHLHEILNNILSQAINLAGSKTGIIYLLDKEGKNIIDKFTPNIEAHPEPRINKKDGLTRSVFDKKDTIYIKNCEEDDRINPELRSKYKSMIAIPLKLKNNVIGVLFLNSDKPDGFSELMIEILQTLATQSAVLIYEKRFESMVNNLTQKIFQKDKDSRFTFANKAFIDMIKPKLDQLGKAGETYLDKLIDCDDHDIYENKLALEYIDDDKKILTQEKSIIEKPEQHENEGKQFWVKVVKTPLFNQYGKVIGTEAIFWDINDEKIDQDRYKDLFDQSPDGIVIHKDSIISHANKACKELFGVDDEKELLGKNIIELIDDRDKDLARRRLKSMHADKHVIVEPEIMRLKKRNSNRGYSRVRVHAKPSLTQDKEIQSVFHKLDQDQDTVFICYDDRDRALVDEMYEALLHLENLDINIWAAHKKLKASDDWDKCIKKALSQSKIAILMEGEFFVESAYVKNIELPRIVKGHNDEELKILRVQLDDKISQDYFKKYPSGLDGGLNSIHMLNKRRLLKDMNEEQKKAFWKELSEAILKIYFSVDE